MNSVRLEEGIREHVMHDERPDPESVTPKVRAKVRNFPNRLGKGANVYLGSAELAAVAAILGKIPTVEEYREKVGMLDTMAGDVYRYLNFHDIEEYKRVAGKVIPIAAA